MKIRHLRKVSFTWLVALLLPVLLGVLAALQYHWLGEISRAERERLQTRLQTDVRRFGQEFNGEITKAFFTFQIEADQLKGAETFAERFDLWQKQTAFPNLVGEVLTAEQTENGDFALHRFNQQTRQFEPAEWSGEMLAVREKIATKTQKREPTMIAAFDSIVENIPALVVPVSPAPVPMTIGDRRFEVKTQPIHADSFVIVKLDAETINKQIFPELIRRNFADQNASYNFTVTDRDEPQKIVFQSNGNIQTASAPAGDASTGIFALAPDTTNILILGGAPRLRLKTAESVVFHQRFEKRPAAPESFEIETTRPLPHGNGNEEKPAEFLLRRRGETAQPRSKTQVFTRTSKQESTITEDRIEPAGRWLLTVNHSDGSLENYVGKTRWHNLGVSFGILALLGASVALLLVTTHRAKAAAQRQIDFVSAVSHEFRTPVAVICSAGDNLADGIVRSEPQIEKYGKLIGREGRRLAEMVEQILEFAGARARRRKYDFQPVRVEPLIETVLADYQPLLEEKNFAVEKDVSEDLPAVLADAKALKNTLQNLVSNSIKYSNGTPWLKISARSERNGNGEKLLISVIDKGIGINPKELKNIFEPFYRCKEVADAQIHGNGLGLSLVKQMVEAHGGKIKVESAPGRGSQFTIELPAQREA